MDTSDKTNKKLSSKNEKHNQLIIKMFRDKNYVAPITD